MGKGGGIAAKSFDQISHFVGAAYDKIATCECEEGCNSCTPVPVQCPNRSALLPRGPCFLGILTPFCPERNLVASKVGAKAILRALLGLPVAPEDVPPPEHLPGDPVALHQTVIEADVIPTQGNIQVERD